MCRGIFEMKVKCLGSKGLKDTRRYPNGENPKIQSIHWTPGPSRPELTTQNASRPTDQTVSEAENPNKIDKISKKFKCSPQAQGFKCTSHTQGDRTIPTSDDYCQALGVFEFCSSLIQLEMLSNSSLDILHNSIGDNKMTSETAVLLSVKA